MTVRFDLPESLDEFDEQDDVLELPCFPYPAFEERPGGIDFWAPLTKQHPRRLNLRKTAVVTPGVTNKNFRTNGRKVLLRIAR